MTVWAVIIAVLATMLLSLAVFGADTAETDVITVENAAQLTKLFADIEVGTVSDSCTIKLLNDIDVDGKLPMLTKEFKGVFDGNGKTISGINKTPFQQFNGTVTNLTLRGEIDATAISNNDIARKSASFALNASATI